MKAIILLIALLPMLALATEPKHDQQDQQQDQHQAQQQTQSQTQRQDSAQANAQSITHEAERQAPSVNAPAVYASHPCSVGWSLGASIPGGGIGGGKVKADPACDRRELARVLAPLNPALALRILCADPIAKEVALPNDCEYVAPKPAPCVTAECFTPQGLIERDKRIIEKTSGK